jgi:glycosyltransferase involved in cell wall biosynthesis
MIKVIFLLANNSTAPYFNWFAKIATENKDIKMSFVCLYHEKPQMIEDVKSFGFDCYWIKYDHQHRKRGLINSTFKLFSLFGKLKPNIIHTHLFDDSLAGMVVGKLARAPQRMVTKGDAGFHYNFTPKWVIFDKLIELKNVSFVGAINRKELKNWIAASKACLVTYIFDLSKYNNNSSSSLKILNYLAQQKVIISTLDDEVPSLKDKAIDETRENKKIKQIVWVIANNTTVPYFRWFAELFSQEKQSDVKFSFILLNKEKPSLIEELKQYNNKVHWIYFDSDKRKKSTLSSIPKLYRLLKKLKPDVVHSHLFDDSLATMLVAKWLRIPQRIVTKQDTTFHWYYAPKAVKYDRIINKNATKLIAVSEECKQFILEKEKADPKKVILINHGIPTAIYQNPSVEFMDKFKVMYQLQNKFVVGTVSRFIEWKGYRDIVKVAELVIPQIPTICFLLIGSGPQKEEIIQLIKTKGLENHFCLPGYIQPENMPSVYGTMNVYLHAARMEPFGFVIAEALAAGLPVVSTPTGAAKDAIIHGENGWLAEYNKPEQLANYLLEVYRKNLQLPWKNAQETAEKMYGINLMYSNYMNAYELDKKE